MVAFSELEEDKKAKEKTVVWPSTENAWIKDFVWAKDVHAIGDEKMDVFNGPIISSWDDKALFTPMKWRLTEEEGEADITAVLDALERAGLISEERAAESLLRRRAPRLGAARVLRELREQGTPEALVEHAAAELRASEVARARTVWQRKFGQPPQSAAERARQLRFLAARGFSFDTARRVIGSAAEDAEDAGWQP